MIKDQNMLSVGHNTKCRECGKTFIRNAKMIQFLGIRVGFREEGYILQIHSKESIFGIWLMISGLEYQI